MKKVLLISYIALSTVLGNQLLLASDANAVRAAILGSGNDSSTYSPALFKLVMESLSQNPGFICVNSNIGRYQTGSTFARAHFGKQYNQKLDYVIVVEILKAEMEQLLCASYNYYSRNTAYEYRYNFVAEVSIKIINVSTGATVNQQQFSFDKQGPYVPQLFASDALGALRKTSQILQYQILSWANSNTPQTLNAMQLQQQNSQSSELIADRNQD